MSTNIKNVRKIEPLIGLVKITKALKGLPKTQKHSFKFKVSPKHEGKLNEGNDVKTGP